MKWLTNTLLVLGISATTPPIIKAAIKRIQVKLLDPTMNGIWCEVMLIENNHYCKHRRCSCFLTRQKVEPKWEFGLNGSKCEYKIIRTKNWTLLWRKIRFKFKNYLDQNEKWNTKILLSEVWLLNLELILPYTMIRTASSRSSSPWVRWINFPSLPGVKPTVSSPSTPSKLCPLRYFSNKHIIKHHIRIHHLKEYQRSICSSSCVESQL